MAPLLVTQNTKKRKAVAEEVTAVEGNFPQDVGLELGTEDEEDGEESDNGDADVFPEIDARSDSEGDMSGSEDEDEDEEEGNEDEEEDDGDVSDDDLHVFPRAKTVISDITGQPKRVYPEIEPDYDSDSSTEDVCIPYIPCLGR